MHISLDSALGRQRRLNSVGESVLQIAPNAAAAYSLRSLTGGDPKVVRVRRSSDNGESDFTASGVSSSALTSFVNEDVELFSNDFEANTSGFTLNTGGSNVAVRNTSDGFSGSGCLQLNLTSSSNSINTIKTDTYMQDTDGVTYTVSNLSNTGFSADNSAGGTGSAGFPYVFKDDDVLVVKYTVTNFSSTSSLSPALRGVNSVNSVTGKTNSGTVFTANGTYTDTLTATADGTHLMFADGNTGSYTISDFEIVSHSSSGLVETWYDQSGNSNDVTQATAGSQPKIVNAGSLVTVGSRASFKFDGSSDFLERETYTQGSLSQPNTFFSVVELDAYADENRKVYDSHVSTARNMLQLNTAGNGQFAHFAGLVAATGEDADADRHLFTSLINGSSSDLRIDGTSKTTGNTASQAMTGIVIGANHNTAENFWDGDIQEIIIYNSNQSSTTTAVETNINSHYSIF
jgi:hypothetical protein